MMNVFRDLQFAFRQLRRSPSFAATAVLTLALGIGANTAVFSLINSLLLKPLPVPRSDQIATLAHRENNGRLQQLFSWNEYKEIRSESARSFSDLFAYTVSLDGLAMPGKQPDRIMTAFVSGNFFDGLELKPAAGRLFLRGEGEVLDRDPIVVLSYDYWQRKFNGDSSVIGRQVSFDGQPMTIVGVAPKSFHGLQSFLKMSVYIPLSELPVAGTPASQMEGWQNRLFVVHGRLAPGATVRQGNATLGVIAQNLQRQRPDVEKGLQIEVFPEQQLRLSVGNPNAVYLLSGLFLSLAVLVLALACVNVANLILVRGTARERELAIRAALGARRARLIGQMITESLLLALIGSAAGVALGMLASGSLNHLDLHADLPINLTFDFDWRVFSYGLAMALLSGIAMGVVPALRVAGANVITTMRDGGRGVASGRNWLRDSLVTLQVAGSLVLLVVAALFVRSLVALETMDLGFKPDQVMNFTIDAHEIGMSDAQARDLARTMLPRLRQIPGVDLVSHASSVPFGYTNNGGDRLIIDGVPMPANPAERDAGFNVVSPDYLAVMGIDLVSGRAFTEADNDHSRDVAIISEQAARKFWPNQDAIGHTFRMGAEKERKLEVVGVVRDVEFQLYTGGKSQPFFYIPYAQHFNQNSLMIFQLKSGGNLDPIRLVVEKTIHGIAPQLPIFQIQTMHEALYTLNGLLLLQIGAVLAAIMGGLGLILAVVGLYGVLSYTVGRRVHEIGIRMALGASRGVVFNMIYRQAFVIIAAGLGLGLGIALLAARAVGSFVIVSVWEPMTYLSISMALSLAALFACYFPARRAMVMEPMAALREN